MSWYRKKKTHSQWLNFFFLGWLFTWKLGPSYWGRTFGLPNLDRRRKQLFFFITFFSAVPISPLFFIARAKRTRTKTKKKKNWTRQGPCTTGAYGLIPMSGIFLSPSIYQLQRGKERCSPIKLTFFLIGADWTIWDARANNFVLFFFFSS